MIRRDDDQGAIVEADASKAVDDLAQHAIGVAHLEEKPLETLDVEPLFLGHFRIVHAVRNDRRADRKVLPAGRKVPPRNMGKVQVQVVQRRRAAPVAFHAREKAIDDARDILVEPAAAHLFGSFSRSAPVTESGPGLVYFGQTGPDRRWQQQVAVDDAEVVGHGDKTFPGADQRRFGADGRWTEEAERFVRDNPVTALAQP